MNKELSEILNNIDDCAQRYEALELINTLAQGEILRKLTSNLFFLEKHRIQAHTDWMEVYYSCKQTSNAARAQWADNEVKELYLIRRTMESGYKLVDAIRSTISIYKKEQ